MNARTERPQFTEAELREQHAQMRSTFASIPFAAVMADPVLRGCLVNTLVAHKRWAAERKAKSMPSAENFALTP